MARGRWWEIAGGIDVNRVGLASIPIYLPLPLSHRVGLLDTLENALEVDRGEARQDDVTRRRGHACTVKGRGVGDAGGAWLEHPRPWLGAP